MPLFSAFEEFGMLEFADSPSRANRIYDAMYASKVDAYNMEDGEYEEAKTYAQAMGIARGRYALERALNQLDPLKAIELLNQLEKDWAVIPGEFDTIISRQLAVAARMVLSRGAVREAIEEGLKAILGTHFVALKSMQQAEADTFMPADTNFFRPDLPFKVIQFSIPVTVLEKAYEVEYQNLDSTAGPFRLLEGDVLTVQPDCTAQSEVVVVESATDTTFVATFKKSHDQFCIATTQCWPTWLSTQCLLYVVTDLEASANAELIRRVDVFMGLITRGVTTWDVVVPVTPGNNLLGPFKLGSSPLGSVPLGQLKILTNPSTLPVISFPEPSEGPIAGGTSVRCVGTKFGSVLGLTVDGVSVAFTVDSSNADFLIVNFTTPARSNEGPVDIMITTNKGPVVIRQKFTYLPPEPRVGLLGLPFSSLSGLGVSATDTGPANTISGIGFTLAKHVFFGDQEAADMVVVNDTTIKCTIPPVTSPGKVNILVKNSRYDSGVTGNGTFEYGYGFPKAISATVSPGNGLTPDLITIKGTNFLGATAVYINTTVDFPKATAFKVIDDSTIVCQFPQGFTFHGTQALDVMVTNPTYPDPVASGSLVNDIVTFTYPTPLVGYCVPAIGFSGSGVIIYGNHFNGVNSVEFGGAPATSIKVFSNRMLQCLTPSHAAGLVNVIVSNPSLGGVGLSKYTFL